MAGELLLDTGALVSLLDRSQTHHQEFTDFFADWQGVVVSTEAVLTESTHLLGLPRGAKTHRFQPEEEGEHSRRVEACC